MLLRMSTKVALALAITFFSLNANAEVSVIVHPSITDSIELSDIQKIFLGKKKKLPGGLRIIPISLERGIETRELFNSKVLKKSDSQLKAYWSRLVFTGKGQPPKEVGTEIELIKLVEKNPNLIGYIDSSLLSQNVKAILSF